MRCSKRWPWRRPLSRRTSAALGEIAHPDVHALIVPRGDAAAMTAAIEDVLARPARRAIAPFGPRGRIERELSFEARTRSLEAIYGQLYLEHRPPHA